jgi:hypothetical protein
MTTSILLLTVMLSGSLVWGQARGMPVPPGIRQADQTEAQTDKNVPPPLYKRANVDVAKLKHDADELASLAQSIPNDVAATGRGMLPKDLDDKLRRIEKLAKHLRGNLTP